MRLALAIASFVILIVHGWVFYDQFFHKWERHQTAYFDQARAMAKTDAERAALADRSPRIEQIIVTSFGENRVDRCTTCHIGVDDPRFKDHAAPLKTHPFSEAMGDRMVNGKWERRHKFSDFGCTVCHDGQGRGLDTFYAHGEDHYWPDPLFEGLLKDENWLMGHFRDPRSRVSDSIMPAFGFADADYLAMTAYLTSLKTPPPGAQPAELYMNYCSRCHGDMGNGKGMISVYLDPFPRDFTKSGFMNSKTEDRLIKSIREGVAGTSMPAWGRALNDEQIRAVFNYVQTSFVRDPRRQLKDRKVPDSNPVVMSAGSITSGERIFQQRCTGCHGKKADGKGPNSIDILPRPRNLRNADFMNSMADRRLFESILYGVQGTAMPAWIDYGLTQKEVGDLVNYLRSLNQGKK